jgi:hypothetical protein
MFDKVVIISDRETVVMTGKNQSFVVLNTFVQAKSFIQVLS